MEARAILTEDEVDLAILGVTNAKGNTVRRHGRTPFQAAFGRAPRLPEALSQGAAPLAPYHRFTVN